MRACHTSVVGCKNMLMKNEITVDIRLGSIQKMYSSLMTMADQLMGIFLKELVID